MPPLHDPDKPAHHIVETYEDGSARRNDGKKLAAAETNKWYIMMTAAGVPESLDDKEIIAANRRLWNGWACGQLPPEERAKIAAQLGLPTKDLAPLTDQEEERLIQALRNRLKDNTVTIPSMVKIIIFSSTYFFDTFSTEKIYIPRPIWFHGSVFNNEASFDSIVFDGEVGFSKTVFNYRTDFKGAVFNDVAYFDEAMFDDKACFNGTVFNNLTVFKGAKFYNLTNFEGVVFNSVTHFGEAMFNNEAHFNGTVFNHVGSFYETVYNGRVEFRKVTFRNYAYFDQAVFKSHTNFSDSQFLSATNFTEARFTTRAPRFYQTQFHEDTAFTMEDTYWPEITKNGIIKNFSDEDRLNKKMIIKVGADKGITIKDRTAKDKIIKDIAADSKRAYIRLRQQMNQLQKHDDEHFFYRQEMDCKALLEGRFYWLMSALFKGVSDYGYSVGYPIIWLGILIGLCGKTYWLIWVDIDSCGLYYSRNFAGALGALGQSISTSFPFFGFQKLYYAADFYRAQPAWLRGLSGFQTVFSFMLIFLLGLGLRNRFRLK